MNERKSMEARPPDSSAAGAAKGGRGAGGGEPPRAPRARRARGGLGTSRPKRRARHPLEDRAAYAVARLAVIFFRLLPERAARWVGRTLGRLGWALSAKYRKQVLRHMEIAFRDSVPRAQKAAWCRCNFEHVGLSLVEFARMTYITRENADEWADLSECRVLDELLARRAGKGLLCVPAHHGNWELCGHLASVKGYPLKSVARPLDNPLLNEMVLAMRTESGNEIIEKWNVLWKLKKLLDQGGIVTMSVDQNGGVAGVFAPMFGALASTVASPAELHLACGAPIVVCSLNRQPDGARGKFHVWTVIEYEKSGDHAADVKAIVTRINAAYEKAVRAYPEQWLWVHRRWKTRPPGEAPGPDGLPPRLKGSA